MEVFLCIDYEIFCPVLDGFSKNRISIIMVSHYQIFISLTGILRKASSEIKLSFHCVYNINDSIDDIIMGDGDGEEASSSIFRCILYCRVLPGCFMTFDCANFSFSCFILGV